MKTATVLLILSLSLITGCAQQLPYIADPRVYNSSAKAIVAGNERVEREQIFESNQIARKEQREAARNLAIEAKIMGRKPLSPQRENQEDEVVNSEGVLGGFPVLLMNDSSYVKSLTVKKLDEPYKGYSWTYVLTSGGYVTPTLEVGTYDFYWTTQYSSRGSSSPQSNKNKLLVVTSQPHVFDTRVKGSFHGRIRLFDN